MFGSGYENCPEFAASGLGLVCGPELVTVRSLEQIGRRLTVFTLLL